MRVYYDSSALIKRALQEQESARLVKEMDRQQAAGDEFVTSVVAAVEISRAIRFRRDDSDPRLWAELIATSLAGVGEMEVDPSVISLAQRIGPRVLRSLDAIHLASAFTGLADVVVTYDKRLATIANEMGMPAISP